MGYFYEKEIGLLPFLVHPQKLAIDVGAHAGHYTHALLKLGAPVVAIDANPKMASFLSRLYGDKARIVALRLPRRQAKQIYACRKPVRTAPPP